MNAREGLSSFSFQASANPPLPPFKRWDSFYPMFADKGGNSRAPLIRFLTTYNKGKSRGVGGSILIAILFIGLSCPGFSEETYALEEIWNPETFFQIYMEGLYRVNPELGMDYILNTSRDQQNLLDDIDKMIRFTEEKELSKTDPPLEVVQKLDQVLIPKTWDYLRKKQLRPLEEEKRIYYQEHSKDYEEPAWAEIARFLIEEGTGMESEVALWKEKLENSTKSFREVAKEYYRSIGEDKDGYVRRIFQGKVRDDLFDLFWNADPKDSFFGPVKTKYGMLFGKVYDKRSAGPRDFDQVEPRIEALMIRDKLDPMNQDFFSEQRAKRGVRLLYDPSATEIPSLDILAYQIDGQERTYRDALQLTPGYFGDRSTVEFFRSITEKAIQNELVSSGTSENEVKQSPEYQFLFKALSALYHFDLVLKEEYEKIVPKEDALSRFYDEHKADLYPVPSEIQLIIIRIPINPLNDPDPFQAHLAQKKAWQDVRHIREVFVASKDPGSFSFSNYEKNAKGLEVQRFEEWKSADLLGRVIEMDLEDHGPGYTSPVLIDRNDYIIYHLLDRREPGFKTLDEMREVVTRDYIYAERKIIRERLWNQQ